MKLLSMTATFGCLDHETLQFNENMTVLTAPNGSGKSTWCAFLRAMLYGLDTRQRDRRGAPADKNRYRPWSGAPMEGLLVCEQDGKVIELRRTSEDGIPMGTFTAVYRDTGWTVSNLTGENAGEILTGMGREVFDRTVFLRQTGLAVSQSRELERRMAALVTAGEEEASWSRADEQLRGWQRRRRYHRTGQLPALEQEEENLGQTISRTAALRQETAQANEKVEYLRRRSAEWDAYREEELRRFRTDWKKRREEAAAGLKAAEKQMRSLDDRYDLPEDGDSPTEIEDIQRDLRSRGWMMGIFVAFVVLLSIAGAAVYLIPRYLAPGMPNFPLEIPQFPLPIIAGAVGLLWVLVLVLLLFKAIADHRDRRELRRLTGLKVRGRENRDELGRALEEARRQLEQARRYCESLDRESEPRMPPEGEACREALANAEREAAALQGELTALGDPVLLDARLDNVREEARSLQRDYDALEIAQEALKEADSQLHQRFSPRLCDRAGEYLDQLTGGRFTRFSLTRELEISVQEGESLAQRPLACLSQGTADQLYLALRLAMADLVLPDPTACPLVLDDALANFDDTRMMQALECLTRLAETRQVLLFTCQRRESEALAGREGVALLSLERS